MKWFLGTVAAVFSTFALLWAGLGLGLWSDRWPAGFPSVHLGRGLLSVSWVAPPSLKAQLMKAQADLARSRANEQTLQAALALQNARVQALAASGQALQVRASRAEDASRRAAAPLLRRAAEVMASRPPPSDPELELCRRADALILRSAKEGSR